MKLIVGLGNPGREYANTRHNIGFLAIDRIADKHGFGALQSKYHALVSDGRINDARVLLMKPMTYMNRSGLAVAEAARFYKVEPEDVLVIVDDTAIDVGHIRIRKSGSPGAHNGLSDIQRALGSNKYPRIRVGIGRPEINGRQIRQRDYVLGAFTDHDMAALKPALDTVCQAVETWLDVDLDMAMNRFNTPKPKKLKPKKSVEEPSKEVLENEKEPSGETK